jgi:hypothetical protein
MIASTPAITCSCDMNSPRSADSIPLRMHRYDALFARNAGGDHLIEHRFADRASPQRQRAFLLKWTAFQPT